MSMYSRALRAPPVGDSEFVDSGDIDEATAAPLQGRYFDDAVFGWLGDESIPYGPTYFRSHTWLDRAAN